MPKLKTLQLGTCSLLLALIACCLVTELWLAPLRPGGSWLVLKVLPLLAALPGILNARRYTFQWLSLAIWVYFAWGMVSACSGKGYSIPLGALEALLAALLFAACAAYARASAPSRQRSNSPS